MESPILENSKQACLGWAASIDKQIPYLPFFSFAFWMAWNSIAFSGSFWLHDIHNLLRAEDLLMFHLCASAIVLIAMGFAAQLTSKLVTTRIFPWTGALIACVGTLFVVITREALFPSAPLFLTGCVLSGIGTTFIFVSTVPYFGSIPPRQSLLMLASCALVGAVVYCILTNCPNEVASLCFIILPLISATLLSIKPRKYVQRMVSHEHSLRLSKRFLVFLIFVMLTSLALELAKGSILVGIPPVNSFDSSRYAQVITIAVTIIAVIFMLIIPDQYNCAKLYSAVTTAIIVLLIAMAALDFANIATASLASSLCGLYNLMVWAVFAYIVFQSESNMFRVFMFGNAALSIGTVLGVLFTLSMYQTTLISSQDFRLVLVLLSGAALCGLLFFMSGQTVGKLLVPIEEDRLKQNEEEALDKKPNQWVVTCESVAEHYKLPDREREVFIALARGFSPQEIADKHVISIYTVRAHTRSIYAKLDVHSRKQLQDLVKEWHED